MTVVLEMLDNKESKDCLAWLVFQDQRVTLDFLVQMEK